MSAQPAWLKETPTGTAERTRVGVVIGVTSNSVPLIHTGLFYWDPDEEPRFLHLEFHARLADQRLPDDEHTYFWVELPVDDDSAATIAGKIRNVRDLHPQVPYGILYEGGKIPDDGVVLLKGKTVGLTCATFVLTVLSTINYDLLDLDTWNESRSGDDSWYDYIVKALERYRIGRESLLKVEHIDAVRSQKGCVRYRPEDVAVAAQLSPWPAVYLTVKAPSQSLRDFLLADAGSRSQDST
jgi:hypothetical protein